MFWRSAARERFESAHARRFPVDAHGIVVGAHDIHLLSSSNRAVLLLHGFNDTPQSMAYLATALHAGGWTVLAPRLPGHGVRLDVMAHEARESHWRATVERAYQSLRATHGTVVVCGQSMGGALATLLAVAHPEIPSVVLLAPYLGMPRSIQIRVAAAWLLTPFSLYHQGSGGEMSLHDPDAKARALGPGVITARTMTELRRVARSAEAQLPRLMARTLYLQSRADNRISQSDAEQDFARIGSLHKAQRWLTGCGHIISADYCRDEVAQQVLEWINAVE